MKISIITRARNRLEYTIRCVEAVARHTREKDYEHIVVDQASTDGTWQWLRWIGRYGGEWFSKVRPIHMQVNTGDWGGMLSGALCAHGEYIVQLDNDIEVPAGWDAVLMDVLWESGHGAVALSLKGHGADAMTGKKTGEVLRPDDTVLEIAARDQVTACYVCHTRDFRELAATGEIGNCRALTSRIPGGACQVLGVHACEMDGSDVGGDSPEDRNNHLQLMKYPRNNPQIWEKLL